MTTALVCLLIICIMPLPLTWLAGYYRHAQLGKADNKIPRQQYLQLEGIGARAVAAQANTWEALLVYLAALFAVTVTGVDPDSIGTACIVFVVCRFLFIIAYLANKDIARSSLFLAGYMSCMYLFYLAISSGN